MNPSRVPTAGVRCGILTSGYTQHSSLENEGACGGDPKRRAMFDDGRCVGTLMR